ncbi:MAG TPA: Mur ligase domain-containing protein, partial [Chloroflexota bacterium]|nr:Mur ligase domain-containing protein [Chloroflexota bacterium]
MHAKRVAELLAAGPSVALLHGSPSSMVTGLTQDSRQLRPGDLFVAVSGFERDGREFLPQAIAAGAAAAVSASRTQLAELAAAFYDHPSSTLPVVGITGT